MRFCLPLAILGLLAGSPAYTFAQTVTDGRVWSGLVIQGRTGAESSWRWVFDSQFRMRDGLETADLISGRGTLSRDLTSRLSLGGGYGIAAGFPAVGGSLVEHRVHQQVVWTARPRGLSLTLRTRIEQRFLEADDRVALRVRQGVRLSRPLSATSRFTVFVGDEVMAHSRSTARVARGFDQHRIFAGVRGTLARQAALEVGYANQYLRLQAETYRMSHVLTATLALAAGPGSRPGRRADAPRQTR
jgi:hypothetical protein